MPTASITVMSDALQTILADPELQNWPNSAAAGIPAPPAEELPLADISPPRSTPPPPASTPEAAAAAERAAGPVTASAAVTDRAPTAPEEPLLTPTAEPAADPDDTLAAAARDDGYDQPPGNSAEAAQETDIAIEEPAAPTSLSAPPAFDEITRRRRPISDKLAAGGQWVKDNWRRPPMLGGAAAAVVAAVTVGVWTATSTQGEHQPAATLTAPAASPADPPPAAVAPTEGPLPVITASARCPAPSSDPMNAARPESTQPWICVRAWGIDGQVLTLTLDGPYVITAVRIMPGVNTESDGQDQWLKYRTLSRVAWSFNDVGKTKIRQSTDSRRELLTQPVTPADCPAGTCQLVASQVVLTVEQTAPPASAPTGSGLNPASSSPGAANPTAFGVSRIEIIGRRLS